MTADAHGRTPRPKGLAIFRQALRYVGRVELAVAVMSFTAVVVLNLTQITLRLFDSSIWWAQEVSLLLAMIAYFIGVSCVFRLRQFVVINFFVQRFSLRTQVGLYVLAQVLTIGFCATVFNVASDTIPRLMRTYSVILHLPMAYWTLTLMVASASMIITSLYFGLAVIAAARRMPGAGLDELEGDVGLGRELART